MAAAQLLVAEQAIPPEETDSDSCKNDGNSANTNRASPPPNCAICLGKCRSICFTDSCLHQFCFKCLHQWSKIKAECPLCKQPFKSIIHNVRANQTYDEYEVEQEHHPPEEDLLARTFYESPRFRYRTTLTLHRRDSLAIQRLLHHFPPALAMDALPRGPHRPADAGARNLHRRTVYRHNLWADPLSDMSGRFRDCTPEFYRANPAQTHRLVPWLHRDLMVLLNDPTRVAYVLTLITDNLPLYPILSAAFKVLLVPYLGSRLNHFLHEFTGFAMSPFDMIGYDRNVHYRRSSSLYTNVIVSSDTDESNDSDILMVTPMPGTSGEQGLPLLNEVHSMEPISTPPPINNVITIETISHSDSDDTSSEVMVVGYIKPPQDRTPEIVDLLNSDSDVVLNEPEPEPPGTIDERIPDERTIEEAIPSTSMVKFQLKRPRRRLRDSASTLSMEGDTSDSSTDSTSSSEDNWPPPVKRKRRTRKLKCKPRNRAAFLGTANDSSDTTTDSDEPLVKQKKQSKSLKKSSKKKKSKKSSKIPRKKESSSKKSKKHWKDARASHSSGKAKARSADLIKSSQCKLPFKKRRTFSMSSTDSEPPPVGPP